MTRETRKHKSLPEAGLQWKNDFKQRFRNAERPVETMQFTSVGPT